MPFRIITFILFVGGAMMAPPSVFGHGGEFLLARLSVLPNQEVRLEITADYGENPMIGSIEEAQDLITKILELQRDGKALSLNEVTQGNFEKHSTLDPTAPIPVLPGDVSKAHSLITGTWQWHSASDSISFSVPKGNPHNVLLWVTNELTPIEKPRWNMLIAGDISPAIHLPQANFSNAKFVIITMIACIGMGVIWFIRRKIAGVV